MIKQLLRPIKLYLLIEIVYLHSGMFKTVSRRM